MGHTPYGYWIENGKAVVDEDQAAQIRRMYAGYLRGLALMDAAKEAGLKLYHGSAKRMMQNRLTLGIPIIRQLSTRRLLMQHLPNSRKELRPWAEFISQRKSKNRSRT